MITCLIRYTLDPAQYEAFRAYARAWIPLIEAYGGTHHGYFMPGEDPDAFPDPSFSFPGLGRPGPEHTAVALFSFPNRGAYERYKRDVAADERCTAATEAFNAARPFTAYERTFLEPVSR